MVSIILVNYNTAKLTTDCIDSIVLHSKGFQYEIIVVDNASSDESSTVLSNDNRILYFQNKKNLGFGKANNIGVKHAKGDYLFFLNTDTYLIDNAIKDYIDFLNIHQNEPIGMIGGLLLDIAHNENHSFGPFVDYSPLSKIILRLNRNKWFSRLNKKSHSYILNSIYANGYASVDYICGAGMFISKELFQSLGGFDENFFLYYEEVDLQKRLDKLGLKRIVINSPNIVHLGRGSSEMSKISYGSYKIFESSLFVYAKKHFNKLQFCLFYVSNIVGLLFLFVKPKSRGISINQKIDLLKRAIYAEDKLESVGSC